MEEATQQQERFLQVKEVAHLGGVGVSTVWRNSKLGTMPKPIKVSANTTRWRLSEINAWLADPMNWEAK